MQLGSFFKVCFASASVLAFVGCASYGSDNQPLPGSTHMAAGGSVETAGIGEGYGFKADGDEAANANAFHFHTSTTQAPADQTYYFDFDNSTVYNEDLASVKAQARYLSEHPKAHVRLEGNTDERGSREYNVALGERRSVSVEQVLEMYGVAQSQISTVSYGQERPASLGHSAKDYALNRRVHLVYEAR